ncbi:hypothetical protein VNI00_003948 [Paramarasmius palmivorus]|uniref:Uncharacterized protein n=1 Tax=Paramarasmius palmivorus TaxID=297713 RepID=A0AAW0DKR0_9AGAR
MGQNWTIIDLDNRQSHFCGKLLEWIDNPPSDVIFSLKRFMLPPPDPFADGKPAVPVKDASHRRDPRLKYIRTIPSIGSHYATIMDLSPEILTAVFKLLNFDNAILNVGLATESSQWALLLICFQLQSILKKQRRRKIASRTKIGMSDCIVIRLFFTPPTSLPTYIYYLESAEVEPVKDWTMPHSRLKPTYVLRNLSTKEYTYADNGRFGSIAHRLLIRTFWSAYADVDDDALSKKFARGKWAGDRFDVVLEEQLKYVFGKHGTVVEEDGWRDVTEEMGEELDMFYDAVHRK